MKYKSLLPLIFLLLLISSVFAFPVSTNYVTDTANIIDSQSELELNSLISQFEKNTTVEIAILTIDTLDGEPIDDYAVNLFREWGIGKKDINNGMLILVAVEDREYRIEVGYGLEGIMPDSLAGRIARENLVPYFKEENYGEGIYATTLEYMSYIKEDPTVVSKYTTSDYEYDEKYGILWAIFPIILLIILSVVFFISNLISKKKRSKSQLIGIIMTFLFLYFVFHWGISLIYLIFSLIGYFTGFSGGGSSGGFIGPGFGGGFSGGSGGFSSGGFSGFGGGFSGGGGASGGW